MKKGSRLEQFPGYAQLDDAQSLFLSAVWGKLPSSAFDELKAVAQGAPEHDLDEIEAWASQARRQRALCPPRYAGTCGRKFGLEPCPWMSYVRARLNRRHGFINW